MVASLTTVQALMEKGAELQEIATPYLDKAKHADGRAELFTLANENVVKPGYEAAAPYVQPYVESANTKIVQPTRQLAAPYVANAKKAFASLQHVRAHPREAADELKSTAIDLIKYDRIVAYREYVLSDHFMADTVKLIKTSPSMARDMASRSVERMHAEAVKLGVEVQAKRESLKGAWKKGYEIGRSVELDHLRLRARALVAEMQATIVSGVHFASAKTAGANALMHDMIASLTKVFGLDAYFHSTQPDAATNSPPPPTAQPASGADTTAAAEAEEGAHVTADEGDSD